MKFQYCICLSTSVTCNGNSRTTETNSISLRHFTPWFTVYSAHSMRSTKWDTVLYAVAVMKLLHKYTCQLCPVSRPSVCLFSCNKSRTAEGISWDLILGIWLTFLVTFYFWLKSDTIGGRFSVHEDMQVFLFTLLRVALAYMKLCRCFCSHYCGAL
jgi:hypothetical protein